MYDKKLDGVVVKTDSKYVSNVANKFIENWRINDFHKIDGNPIKNREDIEELDRLLQNIRVNSVFIIKNFKKFNFKADIQYVEFTKDGENILLKYLKEEGIMNEDLR